MTLYKNQNVLINNLSDGFQVISKQKGSTPGMYILKTIEPNQKYTVYIEGEVGIGTNNPVVLWIMNGLNNQFIIKSLDYQLINKKIRYVINNGKGRYNAKIGLMIFNANINDSFIVKKLEVYDGDIQINNNITTNQINNTNVITNKKINKIEEDLNKEEYKVSVVLLCFNHWKMTKQCIDSVLLNSKDIEYELIIVNNNSIDETKIELDKLNNKNNIKVIHNNENLGFAKGMNVGAKNAKYEYIVFLNNDTYCYYNWLKPLVKILHRNKQIGILCPITNNCGNEICIRIEHNSIEDYYNKVKKITDILNGWVQIEKVGLFCGVVRKSEFFKLEMFDENYINGWEDDDLSEKYKLNNQICAYTFNSIVYHIGSVTIQKMNETINEKNMKNKLYYEKKWNKKWTSLYIQNDDRFIFNNNNNTNNKLIDEIHKNIINNKLNQIYIKRIHKNINNINNKIYIEYDDINILYTYLTRINYNNKYLKFKERTDKNINRITKPIILIFGMMNYNSRFQREQHFAKKLSLRGYKVFYIDTEFSNKLTCKDINENLIVINMELYTPDTNVYSSVLNNNQIDYLINSINNLRKKYDFNFFISIISNPFWYQVIQYINNTNVIYNCMDYYKGFNTHSDPLLNIETNLIKNSYVIYTSPILRTMINMNYKYCKIIRNGCEFTYFNNIIKVKNNRPVIGYYGAISDWFDNNLYETLIKVFKQCDFYLIGDIMCLDKKKEDNIKKLKNFENVKYFGEVPYNELHKYIKYFDIGIIPFILNDLIKSTNPVKLYEMLSLGIPIVLTNMEDVKTLNSDHLYYRSLSVQDFINNINKALNENNPKIIEDRINYTKLNDWEYRINDLEKVITKLY